MHKDSSSYLMTCNIMWLDITLFIRMHIKLGKNITFLLFVTSGQKQHLLEIIYGIIWVLLFIPFTKEKNAREGRLPVIISSSPLQVSLL